MPSMRSNTRERLSPSFARSASGSCLVPRPTSPLSTRRAHPVASLALKPLLPLAGPPASANVAAVELEPEPAPDPVPAPSLMQCEAVDYDTPALSSNYFASLADDESVDSAYNAFVAVPGPPAPDPPAPDPVVPAAPKMEGPWFEVIYKADGRPDEVVLFNRPSPDATGYNPTWLADRGFPSTAAELNALHHCPGRSP